MDASRTPVTVAPSDNKSLSHMPRCGKLFKFDLSLNLGVVCQFLEEIKLALAALGYNVLDAHSNSEKGNLAAVVTTLGGFIN